jgi:hypothetical protein
VDAPPTKFPSTFAARRSPASTDALVRFRAELGRLLVLVEVANSAFHGLSPVAILQRLSVKSGGFASIGLGAVRVPVSHTSHTRYSSRRAPHGRTTAWSQIMQHMPVGVSLRFVIIAWSRLLLEAMPGSTYPAGHRHETSTIDVVRRGLLVITGRPV